MNYSEINYSEMISDCKFRSVYRAHCALLQAFSGLLVQRKSMLNANNKNMQLTLVITVPSKINRHINFERGGENASHIFCC